MENGADVNTRNSQGRTRLSYPVMKADVQTLKILLDFFDLDINQVDWNGSTLLHLAAICNRENSHLGMIDFLLNKGADINTRNYKGNSILHHLVKKFDIEQIKLFSSYGADVNLKNDKNEIPLFKAIRKSSIKIVKPLIEHGSDVIAKNKSQETPLHQACEADNQQLKIIKLLVENGARIQSVNMEYFHASNRCLKIFLNYCG